MPRSRLCTGARVIGSPSTRTSPLVGLTSPAMQRSSVVFPQPEGPSRATNSPVRMARSTLSRPGEAGGQRRFPAARGPKQGDELACPEGEVAVVQARTVPKVRLRPLTATLALPAELEWAAAGGVLIATRTSGS